MAYKSNEHRRLKESENRQADWKKWGPYLSERAWGTVREDYSKDGAAWSYFSHNQARSRAYRWNEDGLGGFCNRFQNICMAVAFWNEKDPFLKERLFGLSGVQGNHGEDVKEYYFYLDGTPTHSYMKMLYKYPQVAFPYDQLVEMNQNRTRYQSELELIDAIRDAFEENLYFDITIEYAKADQEDILCRITAINRSESPAPLHILPHLWYRNSWSWGYNREQPIIQDFTDSDQANMLTAFTQGSHIGGRYWYITSEDQSISKHPTLLFTENETNSERLFHTPNEGLFVKDGIHDAVVHGEMNKVNPNKTGSKAAAHFQKTLAPGEHFIVKFRFSDHPIKDPFINFDEIFSLRLDEANEFYDVIQPPSLSEDHRMIQRQAFAGLLWSKQFYHYSIELWLKGDPAQPAPPAVRYRGRNRDWEHFYSLDVLSMPDKWEYPWFAAWDLAFHMLPLAILDPEWAKRQLILLTREWYMHPNGQLPAYEWEFNDVNPPVHAWAAWHVYQIEKESVGRGDTIFLEKIFHKLLLNFTWWVNREDQDGNNIFQGGFLGLDNIGVFDRSKPLPTGGKINQADGTAWMAMYCLNMLDIALELALTKPAYEDVATKFFEHFIYIADAFYHMGQENLSLWDAEDDFFYDVLHTPNNQFIPIKVRSFVGLIPLFATTNLDPEQLEKLPRFKRRMEWFLKYRTHLIENLASLTEKAAHGHYQLSIVDRKKLEKILQRVFDTSEFLSEHGLRGLSRFHAEQPYVFTINGQDLEVAYEPGESSSDMFGGNSNWRGPIWFPVNYLVIEALRKYAHHYEDTFTIELPIGSGNQHTLSEAADELSNRLLRIFQKNKADNDHRPLFGNESYFQNDPFWKDNILFYEYFHGDNGSGLGASHQTGWTALIAKIIQELN